MNTAYQQSGQPEKLKSKHLYYPTHDLAPPDLTMTDSAKRNTLKTLATTGIALAIPGLNAKSLTDDTNNRAQSIGKSTLSVESQRPINELEVLITNHGKNRATITDITPPRIFLQNGDFCLEELVKDGELTLEPGQYITVQLTKHKKCNTALDHSVASLNDVLRNNVSIMTLREGQTDIGFS